MEVAQLSLFLKLLETETIATTQEAQTNLSLGAGKKILPDLTNNILCGNSLVEYDIANLFPLTEEEEYKIKPFSFKQAFKSIMDQGGFDAIVGNPPYLGGREWKEDNGRQYDYMISRYQVAEYQFDIYALFWEQAIKLLKTDGMLGYITPNTWLNNQSCLKLREYILTHTSVNKICDYSNIKVFSGAVVLPIITTLSKRPSVMNVVEVYLPEKDSIELKNQVPQQFWEQDSLRIFNINLRSEDVEIRVKVEERGKQLEDFALVKFGIKLYETGKGTPPQKASFAKEHIFEASEQVDPTYRRYLEGKDIFPFQVMWRQRWLKYGANLAAPRDPKLFEGERLLIRRIVGDRLIGAFTKDDFVTSQLLQIVKPTTAIPTLYLLGLLESRLLAFYFKKKYNRLDKTFPEIRIYELSALPIATIDETIPEQVINQASIVSCVQQIIETKDRLARTNETQREQLQRKCDYLDSEIDRLVYELYGLTEEEIRIVEGRE